MVGKHYGRVSETPNIPGENSQEISTNSYKYYGDSKLLRHSILVRQGPL